MAEGLSNKRNIHSTEFRFSKPCMKRFAESPASVLRIDLHCTAATVSHVYDHIFHLRDGFRYVPISQVSHATSPFSEANLAPLGSSHLESMSYNFADVANKRFVQLAAMTLASKAARHSNCSAAAAPQPKQGRAIKPGELRADQSY